MKHIYFSLRGRILSYGPVLLTFQYAQNETKGFGVEKKKKRGTQKQSN